MRQQRIALYGGTFDPVHAGHLAVAQKLLQLFALDTVLFIPAHVAPHKRTAPPSSAWQRYAMLALATQDEPRWRVSSIELESPERPYTVETLARLQREFGSAARLFFIMGADSWAEIDTWREWERVLTLSDHIVVTRPGYALETAHVTDAVRNRIVDLRGLKDEEMMEAVEASAGGIFFTDAVQMNVSATEIRRALGGDEDDRITAAALLPPPVVNFIEKYQLYREAHETEANDLGRRHRSCE
ncbi:MAG: nicotinate (nicotinamide) nucleotide adenylyltransferase [Pyrinomonadaceae bacterium]|jgi:nicotinate-nucleotide adenylyltransferase|nr:nicotinate (nicotinamide) nucleotide adenylyltransferase [Pyrinomonadaceae bacterium]MDQ3585066.1 nicotinate-nucleotide adenylyltransferase [Acidobacteriota bacterium]